MRGCAVRGRVSRKQGRDCIERLGKHRQMTPVGYLIDSFEGTWKTKMWYCQCDNKDGCNASTRPYLSLLTLILSVFLTCRSWCESLRLFFLKKRIAHSCLLRRLDFSTVSVFLRMISTESSCLFVSIYWHCADPISISFFLQNHFSTTTIVE